MKSRALYADKITLIRGGRLILKDLSLSFPTARWTSVVGPNGAGKTSLLKALAGLLPVAGQVYLNGVDLHGMRARKRAAQLAWLAQDEFGGLSSRVEDFVMLGRLPQQGLMGRPTAQDVSACQQAMALTQTTEFAQHVLGELSAGQQQRVRLARALATQAQVLLLDEPLANLDPPHQMDWLRVIRALVQRGVTVVSVLHELPMAMLADEIVVLAKGAVSYQGCCQDPATVRTIEDVFERKVRLLAVQGGWAVLPE